MTVPQQITVDVLSVSLGFLCEINSIARFGEDSFFFVFRAFVTCSGIP